MSRPRTPGLNPDRSVRRRAHKHASHLRVYYDTFVEVKSSLFTSLKKSPLTSPVSKNIQFVVCKLAFMGRPSQMFGEKTENRLVAQQVHSKRDMNTTDQFTILPKRLSVPVKIILAQDIVITLSLTFCFRMVSLGRRIFKNNTKAFSSLMSIIHLSPCHLFLVNSYLFSVFRPQCSIISRCEIHVLF